MKTATLSDRVRSNVPDSRGLAWIALLVNAQLVFVVAYYAFTDVTVDQPRYPLYGLVWINVAALALYKTRPPASAGFRARRRALAIAAAYFGVLAVVGGLIGTGFTTDATGLRIAWITPGWGPAVVYSGRYLGVVLMPAYVIGYVTLSYLLYVTILETSGSAIGGLLGLFSCVSCTLPIVAAVASALFGGTGLAAAAALDASYDVSTVVFVLTVVLLYYRPGFG